MPDPQMRLEALLDGATLEQLKIAQRAAEQALEAAGVTPAQAYAAEVALLDWGDSDTNEAFRPSPEQGRALDALDLAERAANEALKIQPGQLGVMLDWAES